MSGTPSVRRTSNEPAPLLDDRRRARGRRRFHPGATMSGTPQERSDPRLPLLNQLQIATPCHAAWDGMAGSDRERHCESCAKTVHNLIEHTTEEAYRLVTAPEAHICVRMHRDAAGNILTKDSQPATPTTRRGLLQRLGLLAASWFGLSTMAGCRRVEEFFSPPLQGAVCPPPPPGTGQGNGSSSYPVVMGDIAPRPQPSGTASPSPSATKPRSATMLDAASAATPKSPASK